SLRWDDDTCRPWQPRARTTQPTGAKGATVTLRLIHVGLGGWGRDWETNALPRVPMVDRVAVVDSDPTTLAKAREEFDLGERECFTDLATALATVEADAVLITAPLAAHVPIALRALAAGRHV